MLHRQWFWGMGQLFIIASTSILGTIVLIQDPLPVEPLAKLVGLEPEDVHAVPVWWQYMQCCQPCHVSAGILVSFLFI
jgi:hypothetical protein